MHRPTLAYFSVLLFAVAAQAMPWPKNYVVEEETKSPGGWYAIIVPSRETAPDDEEENVDYLANLKTHQVVGKIENAHYSEGRNHFSLSTKWSPDSSYVVVEYDRRYGFEAVTLVELAGDRLAQVDLAPRIREVMPNADACTLYLRLGSDHKVRVRVVSTSDPKNMHQETADYSLFQGTYDVANRKWTVQDGRKLSFDQYELLDMVYDDTRFEKMGYPSNEGEAASLDRALNDAYKALRLLLPSAKFAKVKAEQVAWLKKFEGRSPSTMERVAALRTRVNELRDLLW